MAHPKHKLSKQRRDKRRTHDFAPVPTLSVCPNCGATVMYNQRFFCPGPVVQRIERKFPKL